MRRFRLVDFIIILVVILALVAGFLTYKHFRQTASKQIESTSKIAFQVFLRGVTITSGVCPIKAGEETFISIRNVPYTNLKILDVRSDTKKVLMQNPIPGGKPPFLIMDDYSQMFMYDILVTVTDTATITKDGAVVGGNKVKIGLPITLEGKDYKFNGTVSNIQIAPAAPEAKAAPTSEEPKTEPAKSEVKPTALTPAVKTHIAPTQEVKPTAGNAQTDNKAIENKAKK